VVDGSSKGRMRLPKWAVGLRSKMDVGGKGAESENGDVVAGPSGGGATDIEPLLATPDESSTEVGGPPTSPGYGTLDRSVESVPETVVRKKDKGKRRLVDVQ
jgi:hypothetical protein